MKKIININLNGRVIPIEDSAYEKLQAYIESLRRYFSNEDGRDEIINDIESRISEIMNEKIRKGADCITDDDVSGIISSMGRPEDFEADDAAADQGTKSTQDNTSYQESTTGTSRRSRLYRNSDDKILGGVCSGIANYLNIDPAIIRILFAIVTFGGFGIGILLYILLWIVLPETPLEGYGKRLYRNPDDKMIGGVAGGLAAYFNARTSTIRIIFAAPILLSILLGFIRSSMWQWNHDFNFVPNFFFGSLSGTFILAYVVLWAVLPEARSQYEKMEMRGEKVDVNTIRQNVKEGMQQTKDRLKDWGAEVKESAQNFSKKAKEFADTRGKAFAGEAKETLRKTRTGFGHVIGVIFKAFFLFVAGSIAFGLFVALMALIFGGIAWGPINNFLWTSKWQQLYAWGTLIFFIGVPLIAIITWIVRRIIRVRSHSGYLGWTFGGLWVIGWIVAVLFTASISKDLRDYEHSDTPISITQPLHGKMIVQVSEPALEYTGNFAWINDDSNGWDLSEDTLKLSGIRFDVELSGDSDYHVTLKKYSAGETRVQAIERAEKIQYNVSYRDSILDLGSGYAIDRASKFRGQRIEVEIQIPANRKIRFDESVQNKLNPFNIRIRRYRGWRNNLNIEINENNSFPWGVNTDYVMGKDGLLRNSDGSAIMNDYRYEQTDSSDLNRSIERTKQKLQELEDKKNKLKEKDLKKTNGFIENPVKNNNDEVFAAIHSPVFSIVNSFN